MFVPLCGSLSRKRLQTLDLITMKHLYEMALRISNSHTTDAVTWPWKVKVAIVIKINLDTNISIDYIGSVSKDLTLPQKKGHLVAKNFIIRLLYKFPSRLYCNNFFRPPVYGSNGRTYKMLVMFLSFFFSPRVLGVPSTDRPETLPWSESGLIL